MSDRNESIRQQFKRFRILVIGRANAGKTTLLQRICKTTEAPIVHDRDGNEITLDLRGTQDRGEHEIEHEISFESNNRFIFHDSRGFETGRRDELRKVQSFIDQRAGFAKLLDRLHVIWYCIPMGDSRPFTTAEEAFFSECGTGQVPVIVIFTKFDALHTIAFGELWGQGNLGKSLQEAAAEAPQHANKMFQDNKYLDWLAATKFPPKNHVCLANMEREEADCTELIESTAAALDDEMLESLLVSAQCHNLEICISYAIKRTLRRYILEIAKSNKSQGTEENWEMQCEMAMWFPHISVSPMNMRELREY